MRITESKLRKMISDIFHILTDKNLFIRAYITKINNNNKDNYKQLFNFLKPKDIFIIELSRCFEYYTKQYLLIFSQILIDELSTMRKIRIKCDKKLFST